MTVPLEQLIRPRGELHRFVLDTFATAGRSPTPEETRDRFQLASLAEAEEMVAALEQTGAVHRNPGDHAITHAYPFSNDPTAHRVRLAGGPEVYAMCAIDALGMPFMLRRDAEIASACAACGAAVMVAVRAGAIARHRPAAAVVWLAERSEGCVAATDLCPDLNFFCSAEHLSRWSDGARARGEPLSLADALALGRQVFERMMEPAPERHP